MCNYFLSHYRSVIKDHILQSKQMGRRENKSMNCEGRVPFDLLLVRYTTIWNLYSSLHLNSLYSDAVIVAVLFKGCTVLCHPNSRLMDLNSVLDMDVCLHFLAYFPYFGVGREGGL
jgi:hypothetical protein